MQEVLARGSARLGQSSFVPRRDNGQGFLKKELEKVFLIGHEKHDSELRKRNGLGALHGIGMLYSIIVLGERDTIILTTSSGGRSRRLAARFGTALAEHGEREWGWENFRAIIIDIDDESESAEDINAILGVGEMAKVKSIEDLRSLHQSVVQEAGTAILCMDHEDGVDKWLPILRKELAERYLNWRGDDPEYLQLGSIYVQGVQVEPSDLQKLLAAREQDQDIVISQFMKETVKIRGSHCLENREEFGKVVARFAYAGSSIKSPAKSQTQARNLVPLRSHRLGFRSSGGL